jgi:hypothetical protein
MEMAIETYQATTRVLDLGDQYGKVYLPEVQTQPVPSTHLVTGEDLVEADKVLAESELSERNRLDHELEKDQDNRFVMVTFGFLAVGAIGAIVEVLASNNFNGDGKTAAAGLIGALVGGHGFNLLSGSNSKDTLTRQAARITEIVRQRRAIQRLLPVEIALSTAASQDLE